jgi:hypothetical protein
VNINLNEIREEIQSGKEEMKSIVHAWIVDMKGCQEAMEANPEKMEANPMEMMPVAVHVEFCM